MVSRTSVYVIARLLSSAAVCALFFMLNGCTAVGYGVGSYWDSRSSRIRIDPRKNLGELKSGKRVSVLLKDGRQFQGKYTGIGIVDDEEYLSRYTEILRRNLGSIYLPAIGDTLTIFMHPAKGMVHKKRIFQGFDFDFNSSNHDINLRTQYIQSSAKEPLSLERIHRIAVNDRNEVTGSEIEDFVSRGGLFDLKAIEFMNAGNQHKVALADIDAITLRPAQKMTRLLCVIGFLSDMIIYTITRPAPKNSGSNPGG